MDLSGRCSSSLWVSALKIFREFYRSKMVEALFLLRLLTLEAFFMLNTLSLIGSSSTLNASKLSLIALVSAEVNID